MTRSGHNGGEAAALLGGEGLPALGTQHRRGGAEHGAIGQLEPAGTVEHHPARLRAGPMLQLKTQACAGATGVASGGGHRDQLAGGREFEHRLRVGLAHQRELLRRQPQIPRQQQTRQAGGWILRLVIKQGIRPRKRGWPRRGGGLGGFGLGR
jgi:hypothetical protein